MTELGSDIFGIDLIENYPCDDKQALRQREEYWIRQMGTLNKVIAGRTKKESYEDNKEMILERNKIYIDEHKERRQEYMTEYRKEYNKRPEIQERKCEYCKQKLPCDCGMLISKGWMQKYMQSKKTFRFFRKD